MTFVNDVLPLTLTFYLLGKFGYTPGLGGEGGGQAWWNPIKKDRSKYYWADGPYRGTPMRRTRSS